MANMLCCNPINVDDDIDDMELEEVWELGRSRSKLRSTQQVNKNTSKNNRNKKNQKQNQNKQPTNNRMKRVKSTGKKAKKLIRGRSSSVSKPRLPPLINDTFSNRSASTGRSVRSTRSKQSSGGWGLGFGAKEKRVSISNYVEKIDYPPEKKIAGRGRPIRPPPMRRSRSKSRSGEKRKTWFGKKKKKKKQEYEYEHEYRDEEEYFSSSDSDSEYDERPDFFSMM